MTSLTARDAFPAASPLGVSRVSFREARDLARVQRMAHGTITVDDEVAGLSRGQGKLQPAVETRRQGRFLGSVDGGDQLGTSIRIEHHRPATSAITGRFWQGEVKARLTLTLVLVAGAPIGSIVADLAWAALPA